MPYVIPLLTNWDKTTRYLLFFKEKMKPINAYL